MNIHHTKYKGDLALAKVIADLTKRRWFVFLPIAEHLPYDLIAAKRDAYLRIQVKYRAKKLDGCHKYDSNDFDYIAVYIENIDEVCYVSLKNLRKITTILSNTGSKLYWWEDYQKLKKHDTYRTYKDFGFICYNKLKGITKEVSRKFEWPSKEILYKLLWAKSMVKIGKIYGVSDVTVKKIAKKYNIKGPPLGYWAMSKTQRKAIKRKLCKPL